MDKETLTLIIGVITGLISLVAAVGVLLVNGKVDRLTVRVDALTGRVDALTGRMDALQAVVASFVTK